MFLDTLLFNQIDNSKISLSDHACDLKFKYDIELTKQSIAEKFSTKSVLFVKSILEKFLKLKFAKPIDNTCLNHFTSVCIKDSTRFQLPDIMQTKYSGYGGNSSPAAANLQFEFDLLSGKVIDLNLTKATRQDQTDAKETIEKIIPGSLMLRDLGYFSSDVLQEISTRNAFFISRLQPRLGIYKIEDKVYKSIDLKKIKSKMNKYNLDYLEQDVFAGTRTKVPLRLIAEKLPAKIAKERLNRAKRAAQREQRQLSEEYKSLIGINFFITNVPKDLLATKQVRTLYKLRWQVELILKSWKGLMGISNTKSQSIFRIETYLYATLLLIFLNWNILSCINSELWQMKKKLLSIYKFHKAMKNNLHELRIGLLKEATMFQQLLLKTLELGNKILKLEKKNKKLGLKEILLMKID